LKEAELEGTDFYSSNFTKTNCQDATFRDCNVAKATLSHSIFKGVDLRGIRGMSREEITKHSDDVHSAIWDPPFPEV